MSPSSRLRLHEGRYIFMVANKNMSKEYINPSSYASKYLLTCKCSLTFRHGLTGQGQRICTARAGAGNRQAGFGSGVNSLRAEVDTRHAPQDKHRHTWDIVSDKRYRESALYRFGYGRFWRKK